MSSSEVSTHCKVIHQDEWLVVVEKPFGVLSHPNPGSKSTQRPSRCAFEGSYDPEKRCFNGPAGPIWLIHRLDQGTSGVLLAARDAETVTRCREAFEKGLVEKQYSALVSGLLPREGVWKDALVEKRTAGKIRVSVRPGAPLNSEMRFRVAASSRALRLSLLEVQLLTGRTHQIRVQAASRHHPLLGDDVYGDFSRNRRAKQEFGLRRIFLHAASLQLPHPATGRRLSLVSPLPVELVEVLEKLRLESAGA